MIENPPYHVLILGNGFDLNLGLKTGYCDFIRSRQFRDLLNNESELARHLYSKNELNNWIDIEHELKACSLKSFSNLEQEYSDLCTALMNYLNEIEYPVDQWPEDTHAYNLIQYHQDLNLFILDFNYTPTTELLLLHLGWKQEEIDVCLIKIHGSVKTGDIIFGVEDDARINRSHVYLKKSYSLNFISIDCENFLKQAESVSVFGHSLGVTDFSYFRDYFYGAGNYDKRFNMSIYHYGKEGYKELYSQLDDMTNNKMGRFKTSNEVKFLDSSKAIDSSTALDTSTPGSPHLQSSHPY